ncbi:MAG: hypothetical protein H7A13_00360 [Pseudomonadales bacterium]|nr:hypothetical protein [Pseudomonadales bacterium]
MKTWLNRALLVTTYGITHFTDEQVTAARLAGRSLRNHLARDLVIVSQFRVAPVPVPGAVCNAPSSIRGCMGLLRIHRAETVDS